MRGLFVSLLLLLCAPAFAQPRVLTYTSAMNHLSEADRDTLAWSEIIVAADRPEMIRDVRERARKQGLPAPRFVIPILPQGTRDDEGANPWWKPDTLWSFTRLLQWYAARNDWYLYDINGKVVRNSVGHPYLNWTLYCPKGTFGSSKGLRLAQWVPKAIDQISSGSRYWQKWEWENENTYNGLMLEILADCLGSYNDPALKLADPNRDGKLEAVTKGCCGGGQSEPLSLLMRAENREFWAQIKKIGLRDRFLWFINDNNACMGPTWRDEMDGVKLENWSTCIDSPDAWLEWFYGRAPRWVGYVRCRDVLPRGWKWTTVCGHPRADMTKTENLRRLRMTVGTAMLGDGLVYWSANERDPLWDPLLDVPLGMPRGPFTREVVDGDTLYGRHFRYGYLWVNPNPRKHLNVPANDAAFVVKGRSWK